VVDKKIIDSITTALNTVLDKYQANHHDVIFDNESDRKSHYYKLRKKRLKAWKNSKKCIYRDCNNKSIKKSHSIQKEGPLRAISNNGVILTPELKTDAAEVGLNERGIGVSSVFPGFCVEHELLFEKFENDKDLKSPDAIYLQVYRSICREIVRIKHEVNYAEKEIMQYKKIRNKKVDLLIKDELGENWSKDNKITIKEIEFPKNPILSTWEDSISDLKKVCNELENEHLTEIEFSISNPDKSQLEILVFSLDIKIPVALSGMGTFYITEDKITRRVIAILGVYPDKNSTIVVIHSKKCDAKALKVYLASFQEPFGMLNMIEVWMVRGTDHWFLSKEVWENKTAEGQSTILNEILDSTKGIDSLLNFSIFDDLRSTMIKMGSEIDNIEDSLASIIANEKSKF